MRPFITIDVVAAIVADVRTGMGVRGAAWRQGFSQQCVQNWVKKGEQLWLSGRDWDELDEIEKLYVFFAQEVNRARGECERELVDAFFRDPEEARDWRACDGTPVGGPVAMRVWVG
jgi:hypothetical protein